MLVRIDRLMVVSGRIETKVDQIASQQGVRILQFDIIYGEGISKEGDLLDLAVNHNIVEKSGAWFSFKGERLGQGRDNVKNMLKEKEIKQFGNAPQSDVKAGVGGVGWARSRMKAE